MSLPEVPADIQILLNCIRDRSDLELPEMKPLTLWIEENAGAQLIVSKALAANKELESALESIEIDIPKRAFEKVFDYVERNKEIDDEPEDLDAIKSAYGSSAVKVEPKWYHHKKLQFFAGVGSAIAALFLVFMAVSWIFQDNGEMDPDAVAKSSIEWFVDASQNGDWKPGLQPNASFDMPGELRIPPSGWMTLSTEYGPTSVFDFHSRKSRSRAMLFVFRSDEWYDQKFLGGSPKSINGEYCHGVSQKSGHTFVLTVNGATSNYQEFVNADYQWVVAPTDITPSNGNHQLVWNSLVEGRWMDGLGTIVTK